MNTRENIVIGDESALHLYLHSDKVAPAHLRAAFENPLVSSAQSMEALSAFNMDNPLYGGSPVTVLVGHRSLARRSADLSARVCSCAAPRGSFLMLREGLYVVSPELLFLRMAQRTSLAQLVKVGTNLCARYYLDLRSDEVLDRTSYLTTPQKIADYLANVRGARGAAKGMKAAAFLLGNSGSPAETQAALLYTLPYRYGGFGLPFDAMNLDVQGDAGSHLIEQTDFNVDLANTDKCFALEYDGALYHEDADHDKRRRNDLASLGWTIYPIGKDVLGDPDATIDSAHQIAKLLGVRLRCPERWEERYVELRRDLGLKV